MPKGMKSFLEKLAYFHLWLKNRQKETTKIRVAGALRTKSVTSINKKLVREFLIEIFISAIKAKWPRDELQDVIYIQQDNAKTHSDPNDVKFCRVAREDGFDIRLICQPG